MTSLAQTIPIQILEQIIAYVSGVVRVSSHRLSKHPWPLNKSFIPFLGVCREWRSVAVLMMYQEVAVSIDSDCDRLRRSTYFLPSMVDTAHLGAEALVKAAHLQIPFRGVLNGRATTLLQSESLKGTTFGNTNELIVVLEGKLQTRDKLTTAEIDANVREFAALISRMFPTVRDPFVYAGMPVPTKHRDRVVNIVDLIASGRKGVAFEDPAKDHYIIALPNIARLEHIMLDFRTFGETHVELVRRNSSSLKCIHLYGTTPQDIHDIVCDSNGNLIEYPSVWKFEFAMKRALTSPHCDPPVGNAFPNITHLFCEHAYPFTSLSFMENFKLLESLYMPADDSVKDMFKKSGWLDRNQFPQLHSVHFVPNSESAVDGDVSDSLTLPEIALRLSPNIETVKIDSHWMHRERDTMRTLEKHVYMSSIRVLDILCAPFTCGQVSHIIAIFPHLIRCSVTLTHEAPGSRYQLSAGSIEKQQNLVGTRTSKSKLLLLRICRTENLSFLQILERALALAALIPSVKRIELPKHNNSPTFEQSLSKVKGRKAFRAHADRFTRLLINPTI